MLLPLLHRQNLIRQQAVRFTMRIFHCKRIGCLGEAHYHTIFFIYPIIDEVNAVLAFNCQIFFMCCSHILRGYYSCTLFTPQPLSPVYDVLLQMESDRWKTSTGMEERAELFARFFNEISNQAKTLIILFEDIHWADEATVDFFKFFTRRITVLPCMFICTYCDDEIDAGHHLRTVFGQLPLWRQKLRSMIKMRPPCRMRRS